MAMAAAGILLPSCASPPKAAPPAPPPTHARSEVCPLTGTPPSGATPQRPALAIKVDNSPAARPQSGLDKADVVFEEPVEGGITRYVAVFQCQEGGLVGPIRSARNIDIGILGQLGHPLLVHVGGIQPVLSNIEASPLVNVDLGTHPSVVEHVPGRRAPYSTYATTSALWGLEPGDTTPPNALFDYSTKVPTGTVGKMIAIPFSGSSNVVWLYEPTLGRYLRFYGTTPDILSTGIQESACNVVVEFIDVTYGPWVEDAQGSLEVQANLYQHAGGRAEIFRNGVEIAGTWSTRRARSTDPVLRRDG